MKYLYSLLWLLFNLLFNLFIYISLYNFDYIIKLDLRLTEMKQLLPLSANCLVQIIVD